MNTFNLISLAAKSAYFAKRKKKKKLVFHLHLKY